MSFNAFKTDLKTYTFGYRKWQSNFNRLCTMDHENTKYDKCIDYKSQFFQTKFTFLTLLKIVCND